MVRWLARDETRELLLDPTIGNNIDRLRDSLVVALSDDWIEKAGIATDGVDLETIANALLLEVLTRFLSSLEPADAVSIASVRTEARFDGLQTSVDRIHEQLAQRTVFETQLPKLPPHIRDLLQALAEVDRTRAQELLAILADEKRSPAETIGELLRGPEPKSFEGAPGLFWLALGEMAGTYLIRDGMVRCFEEAAGHAIPGRAHVLARAALGRAELGDQVQAQETLARAREIAGKMDSVLQLAESMLHEDSQEIVRVTEGMPYFIDGFSVAHVRSLALAQLNRVNEAIALLRTAVIEHPEFAAQMLWLANLLLSEAEKTPQGDTARKLRQEALEFARRARDLRRRWRGESGECVEVMARAAVSLGDRRSAMRFSLAENEATQDEANSPVVLQTVAFLLLDTGQVDRASDLADRIQAPFQRLSLTGAVAAARGDREQAEHYLHQAFELARHDGERIEVLGYMATAGIWPLPDFDRIEREFPERAAQMTAGSALVRGDYEVAIKMLRPLRRTSARMADLLATAYQKAGQLDDAVGELQEAAKHFRDPELSVQAAFILADAKRWDQAVNIAQQALIALPPGSFLLTKLRILLINGLGMQGDWLGAEEQARRLLETEPENAQAAWALVHALLGQSRLEEAWAVISDRRLVPDAEDRSGVWIELASRFTEMRDWVERGLEYFQKYRDSEKLCFSFIQAVVRHPDATLNEAMTEGVKKAHIDFMARFPESDFMKPYPVKEGDDPLAALREILEPGAAEALQQSRDVEEGRLPMGVLATGSRHSYMEVWVVGGPGILPIYLNLDAINDVESAYAVAALDKEVVLDGSALAVLSLLPVSIAQAALAAFSRTVIPAELRTDAVRADEDLSDPSIGLVRWDPEAGRIVITEFPAEKREAWRNRTHWIRKRVLELATENVHAFPDFDNADPAAWSWLSALQLAKTRGVAIYCDDAWTRRLAAENGVPAFGSLHLLAILSATGYVSPHAYVDCLATLRDQHAVMLPITHEELLELAASENWGQGIGALQIAQAGFWAWREAASAYDAILVKVARDRPQALPGWVQAGAFGASRAAPQNMRIGICAAFLASAIVRYGQVDSVPLLLESVRLVAKRVGAADPLGVAAVSVRDQLIARFGYRQAGVVLTSLTAKLPDEERHALSRVLFTLGSST